MTYEIKPYMSWTLEECQVNGLRPSEYELLIYQKSAELMETLRGKMFMDKLSDDRPKDDVYNAYTLVGMNDYYWSMPGPVKQMLLIRILRTLNERKFIELWVPEHKLETSRLDFRMSSKMLNSHIKYNEDFKPSQFRDAVMYYLVTNARIG